MMIQMKVTHKFALVKFSQFCAVFSISNALGLDVPFLQNTDEEEEVWSSGGESDFEQINDEEPELPPVEEEALQNNKGVLGTWLTILIACEVSFDGEMYNKTTALAEKIFCGCWTV